MLLVLNRSKSILNNNWLTAHGGMAILDATEEILIVHLPMSPLMDWKLKKHIHTQLLMERNANIKKTKLLAKLLLMKMWFPIAQLN